MRPQRTSRSSRTLAAGLVAAGTLALGAGGCSLTGSGEDLVAGKQGFVEKCGACHVLNRAGTKGLQGPNLDDAFRRSLQDGMDRSTIEGVVYRQILYPARNSSMPAKLFTGEDARHVAAYVAKVAAARGEDTGALADAVKAAGGGEPAVAENGVLDIPADPGGQLAYVTNEATAPPGPLTISSPNESAVPHNIALEGNGLEPVIGDVVQDGGVSEIEVELEAGEYVFFCSVPGHREGGMEGKLTVK